MVKLVTITMQSGAKYSGLLARDRRDSIVLTELMIHRRCRDGSLVDIRSKSDRKREFKKSKIAQIEGVAKLVDASRRWPSDL